MERREALQPEFKIDKFIHDQGDGSAVAEVATSVDTPTVLDADALAAKNLALLGALPSVHTDRPIFCAVLERPDGERAIYISAEIEADGSFAGEGTAHYFKKVGRGFGSDPSQVPGPINIAELFARSPAVVTLGISAEVSPSPGASRPKKPDSISTLENFRKKAADQPRRDHFLGMLGVNGLTPGDYKQTGGFTVAELDFLQDETDRTQS